MKSHLIDWDMVMDYEADTDVDKAFTAMEKLPEYTSDELRIMDEEYQKLCRECPDGDFEPERPNVYDE